MKKNCPSLKADGLEGHDPKKLNLQNVSAVESILGISSSTFWRLRKNNGFLSPVKINGSDYWPLFAVEEWLKSKYQ
ncbi:helix-turn-helix transcriptional regulator [Vibrio breoganii]